MGSKSEESKMASLRFRMNWTKAIEGVHFLASIHPGITPYYLAKVFFFADKEHMVDWGRPICGDRYVAMEHGPVPSGIYNLVKRDEFLDDDIIAEFDRRVRLEDRAMFERVSFNAVALSRSDMEYLAQAERIYTHMSFAALREHVHRDPAWRDAWDNRFGLVAPMDMEKMLDENLPDRDEVLKELSDKAAYAG